MNCDTCGTQLQKTSEQFYHYCATHQPVIDHPWITRNKDPIIEMLKPPRKLRLSNIIAHCVLLSWLIHLSCLTLVIPWAWVNHKRYQRKMTAWQQAQCCPYCLTAPER